MPEDLLTASHFLVFNLLERLFYMPQEKTQATRRFYGKIQTTSSSRKSDWTPKNTRQTINNLAILFKPEAESFRFLRLVSIL